MGCCKWLGMPYHLRRWQEVFHELLSLGDPKCKLCTEPGKDASLWDMSSNLVTGINSTKHSSN